MKELHEQISQPQYDPDKLLDFLRTKMKLKNDTALSRALEEKAHHISKIRPCHLGVGASILIRMHGVSAMTIADLVN